MTKPSEPTGWRSIELYNKITLGVALREGGLETVSRRFSHPHYL